MSTQTQPAKPVRPENGTKRTVAEILGESPDLRVMGINRKGEAMRIFSPAYLNGISMEFASEYSAWTARLPRGVYQQVCIFLPVAEDV